MKKTQLSGDTRIPEAETVVQLWDTYSLPPYKRNHCTLVAKLAVWFARELMRTDATITIDIPLLESAALLHDIDKSIPRRTGEHHPDTGVRVLRELGYTRLADIIRTNPLHSILDQTIAPNTWEEKLLYLSDKMVKHAIGTVDTRFALWRAEQLPSDAMAVLDITYPMVKELERDVCSRIGILPEEAALLANTT